MPFINKDIGSICPFCKEGELIKNPKTGKIFCNKKCWLAANNQKEPFKGDEYVNRDKKIEKIYNEKKDNIKWLNALNNTCLLVAHGKANKEDLIKTANWLYNLKPKK